MMILAGLSHFLNLLPQIVSPIHPLRIREPEDRGVLYGLSGILQKIENISPGSSKLLVPLVSKR